MNKYMSSNFQTSLKDLFTSNPGKLLQNRNEEDTQATTSGSGNSQSQSQFPNSQALDFADSQDSQCFSQNDSPATKFYSRYNANRTNTTHNPAQGPKPVNQASLGSKHINPKLPYHQQVQMYKTRAKENDEKELLRTMMSSMKDCVQEVHSAVGLVKESLSGAAKPETQQKMFDDYLQNIKEMLNVHGERMTEALDTREQSKEKIKELQLEIASKDAKIESLESQLSELRTENREHLLSELSKTMSEKHEETKEHIQDICRTQHKELTQYQDHLHQKLMSQTEKVHKQLSSGKHQSLDALLDKLEVVLLEHQDQQQRDRTELRRMIDEKIHNLQEKQKAEVKIMLKKQHEELKEQDFVNQTEMTRTQQIQLQDLQENQRKEMEAFIVEKLAGASRKQGDELRSLVKDVWVQEKEEASRAQAAQQESWKQELSKKYEAELADMKQRHEREVQAIRQSLQRENSNPRNSSLCRTDSSTDYSSYLPYHNNSFDMGGAGDAVSISTMSRRSDKKLDLFTGTQSSASKEFMSPKIGQRIFSNKELFSKDSKIAPSPIAAVKPQVLNTGISNRKVGVVPATNPRQPRPRSVGITQITTRQTRSPTESTMENDRSSEIHASSGDRYGRPNPNSDSTTRESDVVGLTRRSSTGARSLGSLASSNAFSEEGSHWMSDRNDVSSTSTDVDISMTNLPLPEKYYTGERRTRSRSCGTTFTSDVVMGKPNNFGKTSNSSSVTSPKDPIPYNLPIHRGKSCPRSRASLPNEGASEDRGSPSELSGSQKSSQGSRLSFIGDAKALVKSIGKKDSPAEERWRHSHVAGEPEQKAKNKPKKKPGRPKKTAEVAKQTRSSGRLASLKDQKSKLAECKLEEARGNNAAEPKQEKIDGRKESSKKIGTKRKSTNEEINFESKKCKKGTAVKRSLSPNSDIVHTEEDTPTNPGRKGRSGRTGKTHVCPKEAFGIVEANVKTNQQTTKKQKSAGCAPQQQTNCKSLVPYSPTSSFSSEMPTPDLCQKPFWAATPATNNQTARVETAGVGQGKRGTRYEGVVSKRPGRNPGVTSTMIQRDTYTFTGDVTPFVLTRQQELLARAASSARRSNRISENRKSITAKEEDENDRWQKALALPAEPQDYMMTSPAASGKLVSPCPSYLSDHLQGSPANCSRDSSPNMSLRDVLFKRPDDEDDEDGDGYLDETGDVRSRWTEKQSEYDCPNNDYRHNNQPKTLQHIQRVEQKLAGRGRNQMETRMMTITRTVCTTRQNHA